MATPFLIVAETRVFVVKMRKMDHFITGRAKKFFMLNGKHASGVALAAKQWNKENPQSCYSSF